MSKKSAVAKKRLRRGRFFYRYIRNQAVKELRQRGYTTEEAIELLDMIEDRQIDSLADSQKIGEVSDGGFLNWLFNNRELILNLIMAIISLFTLAQMPPAAAEHFRGLPEPR